jgi:DNA modification methylase
MINPMARTSSYYRRRALQKAAQPTAFAADATQRRAVGRLAPFVKNARWHSEEHIQQVADAILEWGWTIPVLVDENDQIIAGHARTLAAQRLGLAEIPVIVARGWSDEQKLAYSIADNKLTENGEWNEELLRIDLRELQEASFDIALTGFSNDDIVALLADIDGPETDADPDAAPLLSDVAVSKPGDVWLLGQHRLLCGDATSAPDVRMALAGLKPQLMVTDPPYGVDYDANWRNHALRSSGEPFHGRAVGRVSNDDRADWQEAYALFPGDVAYVWHAGIKGHIVAESLVRSGFELRTQIVWAKNQHVIGRGDYHPQHEPCWHAVRAGSTGHWNGDRKQTTLWRIDKPQKSETGHSTQKPVECMLRAIENNSRPGEPVYDPFVGSGTTIIAATIAGRVALALEIDPLYVDVAVRRWQMFTAASARLQGDDRPFDEIELSRQSPPAS